MESHTEPQTVSPTLPDPTLVDSDPILSDQMTIIVTTSPIPSSPSPELIKNTLASLPNSIKSLPIIITFDGFSIVDDEKERLKSGKIPQALADTYPHYISNVKNLFSDVSTDLEIEDEKYFKSRAKGVTFLRLKKRQGFAYSVGLALNNVTTPYVLILQHDWLFSLPHPPMAKLLSILQNEPEDVKNIGFVARMSIDYVKSKSFTAINRHVFKEALELRKGKILDDVMVACLHWYDRPHICHVDTYKKIFELRILKKGDFFEDTFGTKYLASICNSESGDVAFNNWKEFAAWMYYPNNGQKAGVRHGSGRTNLLGARQEERIQGYIKESMENSQRMKYKKESEGKEIKEEKEEDVYLGGMHNEEEEHN